MAEKPPTTYPDVQMGERFGDLELSAEKIKFIAPGKTISLPWSKVTKNKITPAVFSDHKLKVTHDGKKGPVSTNFIFDSRKLLVKAHKDMKARIAIFKGEEPEPSSSSIGDESVFSMASLKRDKKKKAAPTGGGDGGGGGAAVEELKSQLVKLQEGFERIQKELQEEQEARHAIEDEIKFVQDYAQNLEVKLQEVEANRNVLAPLQETESEDVLGVASELESAFKKLEDQVNSEKEARRSMEEKLEEDHEFEDAARKSLEKQIGEEQEARISIEGKLQEEQEARKAFEEKMQEEQEARKAFEEKKQEDQEARKAIEEKMQEEQEARKAIEEKMQEIQDEFMWEQEARKALEKKLDASQGGGDKDFDKSGGSLSLAGSKSGGNLSLDEEKKEYDSPIKPDNDLQEALTWLQSGGAEGLEDIKRRLGEEEETQNSFLARHQEALAQLEKVEETLQEKDQQNQETLQNQLQEGLSKIEADLLERIQETQQQQQNKDSSEDEPKDGGESNLSVEVFEQLEQKIQREQEAREVLEKKFQEELAKGDVKGVDNFQEQTQETISTQLEEGLAVVKKQVLDMFHQLIEDEKEFSNMLEKQVQKDDERLGKIEQSIQTEQESRNALEEQVKEQLTNLQPNSDALEKLEQRIEEKQREAQKSLETLLREEISQVKGKGNDDLLEKIQYEQQESQKMLQRRLEDRLESVEEGRLKKVEQWIANEEGSFNMLKEKLVDTKALPEVEALQKGAEALQKGAEEQKTSIETVVREQEHQKTRIREVHKGAEEQRTSLEAVMREQEHQKSRITEVLEEQSKLAMDAKTAKIDLQEDRMKLKQSILEYQETQENSMSELRMEQSRLNRAIKDALADMEEDQTKMKRTLKDEIEKTLVFELQESNRKVSSSLRHDLEEQMSMTKDLAEENRKLKNMIRDGTEEQKSTMMELYQGQKMEIRGINETLLALKDTQRKNQKALEDQGGTESVLLDLQRQQGVLKSSIQDLEDQQRVLAKAITLAQESQKSLEKIPVEPPEVYTQQIERLEKQFQKVEDTQKAAMLEFQHQQKVLMEDTKEALVEVNETQRKTKRLLSEREDTKQAVNKLQEDQSSFEQSIRDDQEEQTVAIAKLMQEQHNFNENFRDSLRGLDEGQTKLRTAIAVEQESRKASMADLKIDQKTLSKETKEALIQQQEANIAVANRQENTKLAMADLQKKMAAFEKRMTAEKEDQASALVVLQKGQEKCEDMIKNQENEQKVAMMELLRGQGDFNKSFRDSLGQLETDQQQIKHRIEDEQLKAVQRGLSDRGSQLAAHRVDKLREKQLQKEVEARQALENLLKEEQRLWRGQQAIIGKLHWDVHKMKLEKQLESEQKRMDVQDLVIQNVKNKIMMKLNDKVDDAPTLDVVEIEDEKENGSPEQESEEAGGGTVVAEQGVNVAGID